MVPYWLRPVRPAAAGCPNGGFTAHPELERLIDFTHQVSPWVSPDGSFAS